MTFFQMFRYVICALFVINLAKCEPTSSPSSADIDGSTTGKQQANRRSIGEYHGLYAPSYHGHYAPATYHGHYATGTPHYHAYATTPTAHYHHLHAHSYAATPAHYHAHSYAPAHYHHGHYYNHETTLHGFKHHHHQPIVYQSVVNTYPTATTVVHKPVAVPVAHPVPVPVSRPVAVEVPRPYPVPVNRPYPVPVIKPVPVPVAQPYPVTVYKPYPVPVYRQVPVAVAVNRPAAVHYATRVPTIRVPFTRYPVQPSYLHSHAYAPQHSYAYAPQSHSYGQQHYHEAAGAYPVTAAPVASYLQQLAALRTAASAGEYEVNEEAAQQETLLQGDYSYLQEQQDAAVTTDVHHHDDTHHHHDAHLHHHNHVIDQDSGYPSLTTDESFKNSLGVPNTDYTGKKK